MKINFQEKIGAINARYVGMVLTNAQFKFIGALKNFSDIRMWKVYMKDYELWKELYYSVILRHIDECKQFDYEIGRYAKEMMELRMQLLDEEVKLLSTGSRCRWVPDNHPTDWSIKDADLLRPWVDMRLQWTFEPQDKRQEYTLRRMTSKIAYTYLTKSGFGHK